MKKIILIILTILLALLTALAVFWDPIMDYLPIDQSGWEVRDGQRYYTDEKGDFLTGWQTLEGKHYHFGSDGAMSTGWLTVDDNRYYLGSDGVMVTGWLEGSYLREDGSLATGLTEIDGITYYFDEDGTPASGWTDVAGVLCCFSENGTPLTGWQELDGQRYYLGSDGSVTCGWLDIDGSRYYFDESGAMTTGWCQTGEGLFYLNEDGTAFFGWTEIDGVRYYIGEAGVPDEGWQEIDGKRYYFNSNGSFETGWLELDGSRYYLQEDGSAATGKLVIDEKTYYFTSTGANILLVNPWNYIPEDYEVELVTLSDGHKVAAEMEDPLAKMMADCETAGNKPFLKSAYRTHADQQANFDRILVKYGNNRTKAAQVVAVPGTSEHQLGLAVDITDYTYRTLDYGQEKTATQQWLMEHCWEYGFILRYPSEKSGITGIIYEPWHYRYVGTELSMELKDSGICLEEYLDQLTGDGTTCGGNG